MAASTRSLILSAQALASPFPGIDPFLFIAYHQDNYPKGNGRLGPDPALLAGRPAGSDFSRQDGWSMYHGEDVPGFPAHPHRGFETVTIVRKGLVDHADSLGATSRYGEGDVQWLTTGAGVQHGEMFPLLHEDRDNPLDLFQIWLNLPARDKMAPPAFRIFWDADIPQVRHADAHGRRSEVMVIAGDYAAVEPAGDGDTPAPAKALPPPPHSWASDPAAGVAIWIVRLEPGAHLDLPAATTPGVRRALYLSTGRTLSVGEQAFGQPVMLELDPGQSAPLHNPGSELIELLMLQGKPIGEPVVARGPFVMNTEQELMQAIHDYQRTEYGGWPWPSRGQTLGTEERFARHADGRIERPATVRR